MYSGPYRLRSATGAPLRCAIYCPQNQICWSLPCAQPFILVHGKGTAEDQVSGSTTGLTQTLPEKEEVGMTCGKAPRHHPDTVALPNRTEEKPG